MFALRKFLIQVSGALLLFASFMAPAIAAAPTVTDAHISISGATGTGGAYKIGDTVTATWNNTAGGDNNSDTISSVTVDFSQFGGGFAVAASNSAGTWTASYTIVAGAIDTTGRNVSVAATSVGGITTTADTTGATVDNIVPTVTDARISISGATGTGGAFKIGDTVTATWNNTAGGDNNSDTLSSVRVNFSQFGGGAAVSASNMAGTWTATYTIVAGAIDATNRNITITARDNAGNETTTADTSNATVDNIAPFVSSITPAGGAASSDTAVDFIVDFSEAVINVSTDDFTRVATGSAAGTIASVSASSGDPVAVTLGSISGSGTLKVNLNGSTNIVDNAGNSIAAYSGGTTHTVNILKAPDAPTIGAATAGDGQVSVAFTAPASNGGSAITGYTVTSNPGGITGGGNSFTTSPITVSGLTNGTAYTFTVTATNAIGTSAPSGASGSATPMANQTITFAPPGAQSFGASPTLSASSTSGLAVTFSSSTAGVCTITSGGVLTFVTAGTCTIDADQAGNASTNAAPTVSRTFTINAVVPGAPTIGTATAGDTQANVSFIAPASNGGATITGYTVTSNPGGFTGTGAGSPITVTGLTNGVSYAFTVTATNVAGTGGASGMSNWITPASPQIITFANPGPQSYGTAPDLSILGGGASSTSGLTIIFTSSTTGVCTITSGGVLTFVSAGTCTINANQAGNSQYLPASQVSRSFTVIPAAPDAPIIGTAIAGDTQASVAFTAPVNTGGTTVTGYTVTVSPADVAPVNGASSPIVVSGLTNGQAYTFTVTADNSAGTGAASSASNSVTPKATQVITFNNPGAQNFGTTPTLIASSDSGLAPVFSSSTTGVCTIAPTGTVSFVTTGTCTIVAEQAGNGSYLAATPVSRSFPVNSVLPGAPAIGTASLIASGVIEVDFTAPDHTGGSAINGYVVSSIPGGILAHGSSSPIQVSGLIPGTAYAFTVAASNVMGTGIPSAASNSVVAGTALVVAPVSANVAYGTATPIVPVISGSATAVNVVVAPLHGSLQINGLGFIYTPQAGFSGADSFSYSASDAYGTSPAALVSLTVEAGEQAISAFVATPAAPVYAPGGSFSVSATGGASGNPVIFASSTPAVCAVAGTTVSMLAAGNCGLTADQAGNALYAAAARVVLDVVIAQGMPQLSWVADMSRIQGEGPFELPVPQSTSSGTFSYASSNTAVATVSGRTVTLVGEGTTILVATQAATSNFAAASVQVQLTVNGRPDPTRDAQVSGGLQAQVDASVRFAQVQGDNIHSRLRQLRTGSNASNVDFALAYAGSRGVPGLTLPVGGMAEAAMPTLPAGWGMWLAGTATFGTVGRNGRSSGSFDFNTGGITLGADRALGENLLLGLAGSWGKQGTDFDGTYSKVDADQRSLAAYGLWRVGEHVFVDGLLANGQLDFDLTRWSDVANANAQGVREGEQWFGALTFGYEHRVSEGLTLTGYGRYDAQRSRLDAYREQGLGMFDLAYGKQTVDTSALAVGLEGSHTLVGERSRWRPFWGVEYRQSLDNRSDAAMNYVQGPQASDYVLAMRSYNDDLLSLEAGMDLQLDSGWIFSLSLGREQGRNSLRSNSIGLSVRYGQSSAAVPMYGEEAASGLQGGERAGCPALSMRCAPSPQATP